MIANAVNPGESETALTRSSSSSREIMKKMAIRRLNRENEEETAARVLRRELRVRVLIKDMRDSMPKVAPKAPTAPRSNSNSKLLPRRLLGGRRVSNSQQSLLLLLLLEDRMVLRLPRLL